MLKTLSLAGSIALLSQGVTSAASQPSQELFSQGKNRGMKRLSSEAFLVEPYRIDRTIRTIVTSRIRFGCLLAAISLASLPAIAQQIDGVWDASVVVNGIAVPFISYRRY